MKAPPGIQALDLLHRRLWRDEGRSHRAWATLARAKIGCPADTHATIVLAALDSLDTLVDWFHAARARPRDAEAGATAIAEAAFLAVSGLMALRLVKGPATQVEVAASRLRLATLTVDMTAACHCDMQGVATVDDIVGEW